MNIGDSVQAVPTFATTFGRDKGKRQTATVIYIHPERRFYSVLFRSAVTGDTFRESYYFADRLTAEERETYANDCDHE